MPKIENISDIDHSYLPEPFPQMYKIHKYWGRKTWNIIGAYIENYTQPGEIILDPFCGSGITIAEALKRGRRAIGIDINPMATFITKQMITPIGLLHLEHEFNKVVKNVEKIFTKEYSTKCKKCGDQSAVIHFKWERKEKERLKRKLKDIKEGINRDLTSVTYDCPKCGYMSATSDKQDENDSNKAYKLPERFLKKELKLTRPSEARYYSDLFTPRNLFLLSTLQRRSLDLPCRLNFFKKFNQLTPICWYGRKFTPIRTSSGNSYGLSLRLSISWSRKSCCSNLICKILGFLIRQLLSLPPNG